MIECIKRPKGKKRMEDFNFEKAVRIKKISNIVICAAIAVMGITATIYKVNYEGGFWTCFREMTVNGTVANSIIALCMIVVNAAELKKNQEFIYAPMYYFRLSATVTESIILLVVLIGYLPFVPDKPLIMRYDMINMHVLIPLLTLVSFCVNDTPPEGRGGKLQPFYGTILLTVYILVLVTLILIGVVPENKIPYSILNVRKNPVWYSALVLFAIYTVTYWISRLYLFLNRRIYWLHFNVKWLRRLAGELSEK